MVLLEQLIDLRKHTHPRGRGGDPVLESYEEVSIMLGTPRYDKGKIIYDMPEWDFMGDEKYALAITAIERRVGRVLRKELFDFGFPMYSKTRYDIPRAEDTVVQGEPVWDTLCLRDKTGEYNEVFFKCVFNPFDTWLKYFDKGILLDPKNILPSGQGTVDFQYRMKVEAGYNPELDLYMKKPYTIIEIADENSFDL